MAKLTFWKSVNSVLREANVILEVLDARLINETRNQEIEYKIKEQHKKLIHVVNKIDLVDRKKINLKELSNPVFVSSHEKLGTTILKKKILEISRGQDVIVGVLGYPNTGKSSVINAISGGAKAKTSPTSGYTTGNQKIKAGSKITLIDSPGVIPFEEKDIIKHALIGSKNPQDLKEPEFVAMKLIEELKGKVEIHYGVDICEDLEETIENIAVKLNRLLKGGKPDIDSTSRTIIMDWQRGRIK